MIGRVISLSVLAWTLLAPVASFANCSVPTGTAGDFIYNNTYNIAQYCNGTNWINMGTNVGGIGTLTSGDICTTDGTNVNCTTSTPLAVTLGGTGVSLAQGNGTKVQLSSGSTTTNDCVKYDANGNTVDTGAACASTSLASGDIWVGSASSVATAQALSGDCTLSSAGAITCTKTSGTAFATSATTDTTNASNISTGTLGAAEGGIPSGAVMPYAGSSAPSGWLLTYGQCVSETTYATLYAAIGSTWSSADGCTGSNFGIPDLRGRAAFGVDAMGGTAANRLGSNSSTGGISGTASLGTSGGAQTHTLTSAEIPANVVTTASGSAFFQGPASGYVSIVATGGGGAHNITPPAMVLNYIIKT